MVTFVAGTINRDFCDGSHAPTDAQSGAYIECLPRGSSIYEKILIASPDNAARGCASVEAETLPGRLRRSITHSSTPRASTASSGDRSRDLAAPTATPQEPFIMCHPERDFELPPTGPAYADLRSTHQAITYPRATFPFADRVPRHDCAWLLSGQIRNALDSLTGRTGSQPHARQDAFIQAASLSQSHGAYYHFQPQSGHMSATDLTLTIA